MIHPHSFSDLLFLIFPSPRAKLVCDSKIAGNPQTGQPKPKKLKQDALHAAWKRKAEILLRKMIIEWRKRIKMITKKASQVFACFD